MARQITIEDDITIPIDSFEVGRPRGCGWDESVCTSSPEYRIVRGSHGHDHEEQAPDADVYCGRHYALELARLVEVHLHDCIYSAADHVAGFERG